MSDLPKIPNDLKFNREQEELMISEFQMDPTEDKFDALYDTFQGSIESSINYHGGLKGKTTIPRSAIKGQALIRFDKALKSFSPGPAKFTTWLHNQMKPINRYVRDHADIAHIPDNRSMHIYRLKERTMFLEDELGRPPSAQELGQDLGWAPKQVSLLQRELKKDLLAEEGFESVTGEDEVAIIEDRAQGFMMDLPGRQQVILEHLMGLNGKAKLLPKQIAKKLKVPESKVRYDQKLIQERWTRYFGNID